VGSFGLRLCVASQAIDWSAEWGLLTVAPPAAAELGTGCEYRDKLSNSGFRDDIEKVLG
jgi:hypothetical protein